MRTRSPTTSASADRQDRLAEKRRSETIEQDDVRSRDGLRKERQEGASIAIPNGTSSASTILTRRRCPLQKTTFEAPGSTRLKKTTRGG